MHTEPNSPTIVMQSGAGTSTRVDVTAVEVSWPAQTMIFTAARGGGFIFLSRHWGVPKYFESYKDNRFSVARSEWNNLLHGGGHIAGGVAV